MKARNYFLTINGKKKKVGQLTENGSFVKHVQASKHFLRKGQSFGIALETLIKLEDDGCKRIILYELEKGEKWSVSFLTFMAKGWDYTFGGFEEQKFLAKEWWMILDIRKPLAVLVQEGKPFVPKVANEKQAKLF